MQAEISFATTIQSLTEVGNFGVSFCQKFKSRRTELNLLAGSVYYSFALLVLLSLSSVRHPLLSLHFLPVLNVYGIFMKRKLANFDTFALLLHPTNHSLDSYGMKLLGWFVCIDNIG